MGRKRVEYNKVFARRLSELLEEHNMKQVDLARHLNLHAANISKYVNKGQVPPAPTLGKIADLFNVSVDYLLGRTDERQDPPPLPAHDIDALDMALAELQRREGLSDEELAAFREYVITGLRLLRARRGQQQPKT